MPLLAPLFLLAIAAVGIPLLVHLVQREKRDPIEFPSLMFLERTPAPFTARRHLRDPWLFLLRALAIIALALAFARPVFGRRAVPGSADVRRREVVVLLDRSFSMRVGNRWQRARTTVDSVIKSLGTGDRMTLVAFDRRANALTAATGDADQLRAALDSVSLTDESTRLAPAITVAQQRLAASDAPRKLLVMVSDFQRSSWDLTDDARMPPSTEIAPRDVAGDTPILDRAVRSIEVRPDRRPGPAHVIVSARIANIGPAARGVSVRLDVGGRSLESRTLDLPSDGSASVNFAAIPVPPDPVAARVVLEADAVPGDNAFHFLLNQSPVLPVLIIESRAGPYLARALAIGDAPRFDVASRTPARASTADLAGRRIVVLADGAFPTGIGAARLMRFVTDGGGLLVALSEQLNPRLWPASARALIPGEIRTPTDRGGVSGAVLGEMDAQHPALALLSGSRAGDLAAARFFKYRGIDTTSGVLARFDDGTAALTEHLVGKGRVLTFGSSLDGIWNDLPRQPAFLPLMQQLTRYAAGWRDTPRWFDVGASLRPSDLSIDATANAERWIAVAPSGRRTTISSSRSTTTLELNEAGVHALRPGGSPGARPILVAANIAPPELDFASFDVLRLTNALSSSVNATAPERLVDEETPTDREARQSTWWYLLLAAVLLLIAEGVVARRSRTSTVAMQ